jgi:hypothetical protein
MLKLLNYAGWSDVPMNESKYLHPLPFFEASYGLRWFGISAAASPNQSVQGVICLL